MLSLNNSNTIVDQAIDLIRETEIANAIADNIKETFNNLSVERQISDLSEAETDSEGLRIIVKLENNGIKRDTAEMVVMRLKCFAKQKRKELGIVMTA